MIDSHCHLDAPEFNGDIDTVLAQAAQAGISHLVNPAVAVGNFQAVKALSKHGAVLHKNDLSPAIYYALGIHPLFVMKARDQDIDVLRKAVLDSLEDPFFLGIGEIGLDGFDPSIDRSRQEWFFIEQLKVAADFNLPVIMHVRHAVDSVLKQLRVYKPRSGIAHAFNGSRQQALQLITCNMALGFGGAMTFTRALQIRRLAVALPLEAIVLETDSPDIAPSWVHAGRNSPSHLLAIGAVMAQLRDIPVSTLELVTDANVRRVLPKLVV